MISNMLGAAVIMFIAYLLRLALVKREGTAVKVGNP
jgi:hypothetical protein